MQKIQDILGQKRKQKQKNRLELMVMVGGGAYVWSWRTTSNNRHVWANKLILKGIDSDAD